MSPRSEVADGVSQRPAEPGLPPKTEPENVTYGANIALEPGGTDYVESLVRSTGRGR